MAKMSDALKIGIHMPMKPETIKWLEKHAPDLAEKVKEVRDDVY